MLNYMQRNIPYKWCVTYSGKNKCGGKPHSHTTIIAHTLDAAKEKAEVHYAHTDFEFKSITRSDINQFFSQNKEAKDKTTDSLNENEDQDE